MKKILLVLGLAVILASSSQAVSIYGVDNGTPFMGFVLNETQRVDAGLGYTSSNDGDVTDLSVFGRFENKIADVKAIKLSWAGQLTLSTGQNAMGQDQTSITLAGLVGAEYKITDALGIYTNITLVSFTSQDTGGASSTSFSLIGGPFRGYSGLRIYI
jgi:hypothetical protein